jgi:isoleucyl-tRNA synthetase
VLEGLTYTPVFSHSQPSTPTSKKGLYSFFPASYVKADTGTGLVHSAPGHGLDDYHSFLSYWSSKGEEITDIFSPVDADGCFDEAVRELVPSGSVPTAGDTGGNVDLVGLPVVTAGTDAVIRLLSSPNLARLVKEVKEVHKHPYDWRTKKPVIVRYVVFCHCERGTC